MAEKKITKKDNFDALLAIAEVAENPTLVEFINHEKELLAKRKSGERKPTAKEVENEGIIEALYDAMDGANPHTITEMQNEYECVADLSNQRINALLRKMIERNMVVRTEVKGKAYFARA